MNALHPAAIGFAVRRALAELGLAARLLGRLLLSQKSWRRFGLISEQIFFLGNYSLVLISVAGMFVGFVMGL